MLKNTIGANSGIGYASAQVIASASEDFHVIMAGRSLDKVNNAMSKIQATRIKGTLSTIQLDVTDDTSIQDAVNIVQEKYGRLDALINNAGIADRGPDLKTRLQKTFEVNVIGAALVAVAFRPLLLKSPKAYSIYMSSGAGSITRASQAKPGPSPAMRLISNESYPASKAAINMIAVKEAMNFGPQGLKVFAACPGFVVSNLRGTSEEERTGWGGAGDPMVSGQLMLSIIQGERDADVGRNVHKDGVHPW